MSDYQNKLRNVPYMSKLAVSKNLRKFRFKFTSHSK